MARKYCYICGTKTETKQPHIYWCEKCQQNYYDNPKPCADLYLFDDQDKLVVGRRKHEPNKGTLDIPGGFLDFDETFEEGAVREIEEELGLKTGDYSAPMYLTSYRTDYPWGTEVYQTAVAVFVARLHPDAKPEAMDDVEELLYIKPKDLIRTDFGFPEHADVAAVALEKLQEHNN